MNEPKMSVLVVDDEPAIVRSIVRALADSSLEVLSAGSGQDALAILQRRHVDVLLSDIDMPMMSGLELLAIARRDHPGTLRMLLTGGATTERALDAINEGEVARFFVKPFDVALFRRALVGLAERIERMRRDDVVKSRRARVDALVGWAQRTFPGLLVGVEAGTRAVAVDPDAIQRALTGKE